MKLRGACAIVTGGADGIGKALVEYLVSKGTKVVFGDISTEKGQELSKRLNQNGKWVVFCVCNVRKESELINLFDVAKREFGGAQGQTIVLDINTNFSFPTLILVNNAGIGPVENFTTSTGAIDAIVDTNLTAVLKATSLATQHFQIQKKENPSLEFCVVNVSSFSALIPATQSPVYSSTKKAVMYFSQTLGYLAKDNIRVNCVLPYFAKTAIIKSFTETPGLMDKIEKRGGFVSISNIIKAISVMIEDKKMSGDSISITPKGNELLARLNMSSL